MDSYVVEWDLRNTKTNVSKKQLKNSRAILTSKVSPSGAIACATKKVKNKLLEYN